MHGNLNFALFKVLGTLGSDCQCLGSIGNFIFPRTISMGIPALCSSHCLNARNVFSYQKIICEIPVLRILVHPGDFIFILLLKKGVDNKQTTLSIKCLIHHSICIAFSNPMPA